MTRGNNEGLLLMRGVDAGVGFCSARAAIHYSFQLAQLLTGCYSVTAWLRRRVGDNFTTAEELAESVIAEYNTTCDTLTRILSRREQDSNELDSARELHRRMYYWTWVMSVLSHPPNEEHTETWILPEHVALSHDRIVRCVCKHARHSDSRARFADVDGLVEDRWMWHLVRVCMGDAPKRVWTVEGAPTLVRVVNKR